MHRTRETLSLSADLRLSYLKWGAGSPVVLLHGLADCGLVWQSLAEALGDRYNCIAPDLRGHGESSKPPAGEYGAEIFAADLERLAERLELEKVRVVAHSWAAKVALVWARQQPDRIDRLVLVDPFIVNRLPGVLRLAFPILFRTLPFLRAMGPFPDYEAALAVARTLKQYRGWSALQESVFQAGMERQPDGRWQSKFAVAARNGVFQDTLRSSALTETMAVPTCLMLPERGLNRTTFQIRPYKQYLSRLSIAPIPGNHWPHLSDPQTFERAVAAFFESH